MKKTKTSSTKLISKKFVIEKSKLYNFSGISESIWNCSKGALIIIEILNFYKSFTSWIFSYLQFDQILQVLKKHV